MDNNTLLGKLQEKGIVKNFDEFKEWFECCQICAYRGICPILTVMLQLWEGNETNWTRYESAIRTSLNKTRITNHLFCKFYSPDFEAGRQKILSKIEIDRRLHREEQ